MNRVRIPMIALLCLVACGERDSHRSTARPASARPVSILVEVYDPATSFVWEGVSVRVVEAEQEWSQCICTNPFEDWFLTDSAGQVLFDEFLLAESQVGFIEDGDGRALLGSRGFEDRATVVLEIDAVGFSPVCVEVDLSWDVPDVFVQVPFF